jgi:hypothetical protein
MKCTPQKTMCLRFRLRGEARELERIAGDVGVGIDVGALVVVAEQDGILAELRLRGADALGGILVGEGVEAVEGNGGGLHDRDLGIGRG